LRDGDILDKLIYCACLNGCVPTSVAITKFSEGPNIFTLSEQQHLVWDTASQSTKRQNRLEN